MTDVPTDTIDANTEQRLAHLALGPIVVALNAVIGAAFLAVGEPFLASLDAGAALVQIVGAIMVARGAVTAGLWTIFTISSFHIFFWVAALGLDGGWGYYAFNLVLAFYVTVRARPRQLIAGYGLLVLGLAVSVPIALTQEPRWTFDDSTNSALHVMNLGLVVVGQLVGVYMVRRSGEHTRRQVIALKQQVAEIRRLGQYTLEEKIGAGGMGQVYRASHALLRRPTAVKLLHEETVGPEAMRRFEREVQLTSELTHPNTIEIYDYGHTPEGVFYYVMEYLDGLDLQTLVTRHGAQSPERVVHILEQVCEALEEAHLRGLVHRDIKPGNIVLCERGNRPDVVKVLDFGLVKDLHSDDQTLDAVLVGTPAYLSPETIIDPTSVGPSSDLYAVGAVGYFLLTGEQVFSGQTLAAICAAHLHERPKPLRDRVEHAIPEVLEELILDCLEKDPAHRPKDALHLRTRLAQVELAHPWDEAEARAWWAAQREAQPPRAREPSARAGELSMTVDVRARARLAARGGADGG